MDKYYVDERSGCIAVRKRVEYEIGNGLSSDLPDVVAFWLGHRVFNEEGLPYWKISDNQREEAHQLCDSFNKATPEEQTNPKQDVIERLCKLAAKVGEHYEYQYAHDCFCHQSEQSLMDFRFEEEILEFIEEAVESKIGGETK